LPKKRPGPFPGLRGTVAGAGQQHRKARLAATGKTSSAPSLRPSQLRCAVVVLSDQSIFDGSSRSASSRSAYSVIRKRRPPR
jgi:hypothetical protein